MHLLSMHKHLISMHQLITQRDIMIPLKTNHSKAAALGIQRNAYEQRLKKWTLTMTDSEGVEYLVSPKHCMVKPVKVVL